MGTAPIRLEQVTYRVGETEILADLSCEVQEAETLVMLGRSGSGKTTALRLVNRLLMPTQGQVFIEGKPTTGWDPIQLRRRIGYVIQEIGLFPHFTVEENVGLIPRLEGWPKEQVRQRSEELLQTVGLDPEVVRSRYPHELSGGQRQRVGVARALAADPPILLMDEPFGALDPITRNEIQREFLALQETFRKTILFVTHDIREAMLLGHHIGVMEGGRLVWTGTADEFRSTDDHRIVAFRGILE